MESHFAKYYLMLPGVAATMPAVLKLVTGDEFLHVVQIGVNHC